MAPSWMFGVSASVNLPLHHKVHKFSSGTTPAHRGGPGKGAIKGCGGGMCITKILLKLCFLPAFLSKLYLIAFH